VRPSLTGSIVVQVSAMKPTERAWLALEGVSVGDTFGERFFGPPEDAFARIARRQLQPPPWTYTDDTEMAMSVYEVLAERGAIDQDLLASRFATRMQFGRGYGQGTYAILTGIREGRDWRALTQGGFGGMGSFGNGAAMRVAPLGAYFADQPLARIAAQARLSAEVTHAHDEGIAGAIAVAVATALAWRRRGAPGPLGSQWIRDVRDAVPPGYTFDAVDEAAGLPDSATVIDAAALGDRDTTCAIVGGIVAMVSGRDGIPAAWLEAREALPLGPTSAG
jgi:ADP-ribosylglycohydrolase